MKYFKCHCGADVKIERLGWWFSNKKREFRCPQCGTINFMSKNDALPSLKAGVSWKVKGD